VVYRDSCDFAADNLLSSHREITFSEFNVSNARRSEEPAARVAPKNQLQLKCFALIMDGAGASTSQALAMRQQCHPNKCRS